MRILDESGAEVRDPDLSLGRLVREKVVVKHHEAQPEVERKTHLEEIWKGGDPKQKLVRRIVDQEHVPAKPAWDETEDIYRYVPYTDEELAEIAQQKAAEEAARKEAEEAAKAEAAKRAEIEALPGKVGDLEDAVAELGVMADAATSTAETEQAIAELGVMVAGLMETLEAKEA